MNDTNLEMKTPEAVVTAPGAGNENTCEENSTTESASPNFRTRPSPAPSDPRRDRLAAIVTAMAKRGEPRARIVDAVVRSDANSDKPVFTDPQEDHSADARVKIHAFVAGIVHAELPPILCSRGSGERDHPPTEVASEPPCDNAEATRFSQILYSRGNGERDNTPEQREAADFAAFRDACLADVSQRKGMGWIACAFERAPDDDAHKAMQGGRHAIGEPHRCKACVRPRRFIGLDIDHGLTAETFRALIAWMQPFSAFAYTTASSTREAPRCRLVFELDQEASRNEAQRATWALQARIARDIKGMRFDAACDRSEQPLYLPTSGAQTFYSQASAPLSLTELLREAATLPSPEVHRATPAAVPKKGSGIVVDQDRHDDLLRLCARLARDVFDAGVNETTARATLQAENARGRWTRNVPADELTRAFDGALSKLRNGEWKPSAVPESSSPNKPAFTVADLTDFDVRVVEAPSYAVVPLIPFGQVTLLGAHGGSGKSTLALTLAAHYAASRPWARFAIAGGKAAFVSLEDPKSIVVPRLRLIVAEYGLDPRTVEENLLVLDGTEGDGVLASEIVGSGVRRLAATPSLAELRARIAGCTLVVVDNASDGFAGNENDRQMVRSFMRMLVQIARDNNAGVLLLAHVSKDAAKYGARDNSYSGSTGWHNSARSRLALVEENSALQLRHEKANLSRKAEPVTLRWSDAGILVPSDGKVSEAERIADTLLESEDAKALLAALRAAALADANIPTGRTGPSTAQAALETFGELPATLRGPNGRKRFWAALARLQRDRRIRSETYRNEQRKDAKRFVVTTAPV